MLKSTKKETAKSVKTLLVMLQSMRGQQVTITLRNDSVVRGTILKVDANMNIELENATLEPDLFYQVSEPAGGHDAGEDSDGGASKCMSVDEEIDYKADDGEEFLDLEAPESMIDQTTNGKQLDTTTTSSASDQNQSCDIDTDSENEQEGDGEKDNDDDDNDADIEGNRRHDVDKVLDYFLVKGTRVRHIDIPADYDLLAGGKSEIERIRDRCKQWTKRDIVRPTTTTTTTTTHNTTTTITNTAAAVVVADVAIKNNKQTL